MNWPEIGWSLPRGEIHMIHRSGELPEVFGGGIHRIHRRGEMLPEGEVPASGVGERLARLRRPRCRPWPRWRRGILGGRGSVQGSLLPPARRGAAKPADPPPFRSPPQAEGLVEGLIEGLIERQDRRRWPQLSLRRSSPHLSLAPAQGLVERQARWRSPQPTLVPAAAHMKPTPPPPWQRRRRSRPSAGRKPARRQARGSRCWLRPL